MKYTKEDYQNQLSPPEEEIQALAKVFQRPTSLAEGMMRRMGGSIDNRLFGQMFWTLKWLQKNNKFFDLGGTDYGGLYVVNLNYETPESKNNKVTC